MKTLFLFSILSLSSNVVAREDPSLFDLSLKGIVVEAKLAQMSASEHGLNSSIVVEDVLLPKPPRCAKTPSTKTSVELAEKDCR